ncbi:MAG: hypothetical protein QXF57_02060, partial [Acidilobaceae archaeon]
RVFEATGKVGRVIKGFASITLKPEDFSSPVSFQMAMSRIYDALLKMMEGGGPTSTYVAEVRFTDDLGNPVVIGIELGERIPESLKERVRARVIVEIESEYEKKREESESYYSLR